MREMTGPAVHDQDFDASGDLSEVPEVLMRADHLEPEPPIEPDRPGIVDLDLQGDLRKTAAHHQPGDVPDQTGTDAPSPQFRPNLQRIEQRPRGIRTSTTPPDTGNPGNRTDSHCRPALPRTAMPWTFRPNRVVRWPGRIVGNGHEK